MRLRITRQLCECIDGIQLSAFRRGYVYEVGTTIGSYLLAVGAAEPIDEDHPYIVLPPEKRLFYPYEPAASARPAKRHPPSLPDRLAVAADRPPRRPSSHHTIRPLSVPREPERAAARRSTDMRWRVEALAAEIERIKQDLSRFSRSI